MSRRRGLISVLLLVLLSAALHIAFAQRLASFLEPDEAVVALMGSHIHQGREFPAFYYGQPYLGSLQAYLVALTSTVDDSILAARLAMTVVTLMLVLATWLIARLIASESAALIAATIVAFAPPDVTTWHVKLRGGFTLGATLMTVALLFAVLNLEREDRASRVAGFAFFAGIAFWTNQLTLPPLLVFAVAVAVKTRHRRSLLLFFVGSAPFWIYNIVNPLATVRYLAGGLLSDVRAPGAGLRQLVGEYLPRLLGGHHLATGFSLPVVESIGIALFGVTLILVLVKRLPSLLDSIRQRQVPAVHDLVLISLMLCLPLRRGSGLHELIHWVPLMALLLVVAPELWRRRWLHVVPVAVVVVAVIELALWLPALDVDNRAIERLVEALEVREVHSVHAEHRPAYLLAYLSNERIVATPARIEGEGSDRYPTYTVRVLDDRHAAFVFEAGSRYEHQFQERTGRDRPFVVAAYHVYFAAGE